MTRATAWCHEDCQARANSPRGWIYTQPGYVLDSTSMRRHIAS